MVYIRIKCNFECSRLYENPVDDGSNYTEWYIDGRKDDKIRCTAFHFALSLNERQHNGAKDFPNWRKKNGKHCIEQVLEIFSY